MSIEKVSRCWAIKLIESVQLLFRYLFA